MNAVLKPQQPLAINGKRLWDSLMEMAKIGATQKGGVCRLALTDLDRDGRDLFVRWAKEAGCTISVDQMGNVFARRAGRDDSLPPVVTGSHADSQPTGGRFDGIYGVLGGLEVIRSLNDHGIETERPIEVVIWTNEEGSRFAPAMVASGVFAGVFTLDYGLSRADVDGKTMGEELKRIGYAGDRPMGKPIHAAKDCTTEELRARFEAVKEVGGDDVWIAEPNEVVEYLATNEEATRRRTEKAVGLNQVYDTEMRKLYEAPVPS